MSESPARVIVAFLDGLRDHKDTLLRGAALFLGGAALVLAGSLIGLGTGRFLTMTAGLIAVTGVITMFLAFFVYVLPPLLPSR